jgi:hypothetical protein
MVPGNKQSRRYKQQLSHVLGLPTRGGNPRMCDSQEAFADSFQKLYERCQPCVVKDGDYFEGQ